MYLEHLNSALTKHTLYTELIALKKMILYTFQSPKRPGIFKSLSNSIASALGIMKPGPPSRAMAELNGQE